MLLCILFYDFRSLLRMILDIVYFCCSVPPSIYKKVKQVPENKREARLIKELEEILSREGLSSNPSEKGELGC